MEKNRNKKKLKKKKKFNWKLFVEFMIFQLIFSCLTAPIILLYGPFETAKSRFVGTAMGSMHYKWLATSFLSDSKIEEITGRSENKKSMNDEESIIDIPKEKDSTITHSILSENSNFVGHVLFVKDSTRIKVGCTSKLNVEGETTSQIAENNNAVAAINGGAFTGDNDGQEWTGNGGNPTGVIISNGKVVFDDSNNKKCGTIGMTKEGRLIMGHYTLDELIEKNVTESVSFDQMMLLVDKGELVDLSGKDGGGGGVPRTLIGQKQDSTIVLVVLNSKKPGGSEGATFKEAQEVMLKLGCVTAGTLDGGKSTTMYYDGEVVNIPSYSLGERYIATAIIVK